MIFGAVGFLVAVLAGAIPVVLHMINWQKAKDLPFPTLRFLRISVEKTRRRKVIQDVLLMLLRVAVLVLLALGLALIEIIFLKSLLGGGARSAVVIILDNSASMGTLDPDRQRFETAGNAAEQILEELRDGDEVALLATNGPIQGERDKLDRTQEKVRQMLAELRQRGPSYERADLAVQFQQARKLLGAATATNKQIYVLSDFQAISWEGLKKPEATTAESEVESEQTPAEKQEKEAAQIPVVGVDCHRAPKPNVAVQNVALETAVPVAGLPVKASVEVFNPTAVSQQRVVELYVDGTKQASSPTLNIPPEGRATHDFHFTFPRGGLHRGEARLAGSDGSKFDDRRFFAMEVDQAIPVAVVKAQRHEIAYLEDTFYLEQALSPGRSGGWALQTNVLVAADLLSEPLEGYKVIFCVDLPAPSSEVAERLRSFVERGGNLVWVCGEAVNFEAYNQMDQQAGGSLLPAPLLDLRAPGPQDQRDSWHISFLDKQHPALAQLVQPVSLYESVLIYKHFRIDAASVAAARVLARLDDGEPLLVQRDVGQGRVLLLATSAHVGWSNLPLRPIFLPLVARLVFYLSGAEQARHESIAGAPLVLPLPQEAIPVGVEVLPPSGETFRLQTHEEPGQPGQVFRYTDTHEIGVYVLRLFEARRPTQIAYSVNVDPEEASPEKIDREEFQNRLGRTPVVFADDPEDLSSTFKGLREGKSFKLAPLLLSCTLFLLVFEALISNLVTPKREPAPAVVARRGVRRIAQPLRANP